MKRRSFVAGLGVLTAGTAAAMGTGAFSSAEATRDVSVELADDASAYLALEATSEYAEENGDGLLELDFGQAVSGGGEHVGEDSSTIFGSGNPNRNVFTVQNQGTNEVEVSPTTQVLRFDKDGNSVSSGGELLFNIVLGTGQPSQAVLQPGDSAGYYVQVATGDNPPDTVDTTFEINANET